MDWEPMSNEENYCFDVAGYLHVPGVLTREEIDVLYQRLDKNEQTQGMLSWPKAEREPFRNLLIHPKLVWYLNQIIGYGFRLDQEPTWIYNAANQVITPLAGGNEPQDPARTYYFQNGRRYCQSVRAIWALTDVEKGDGGFVMVPCTHKSRVETPVDIVTGEDDMGLIFQPSLKAGDLLLVAGNALQGMRPWQGKEQQSLLSYSYAGRAAIQSAGNGDRTRVAPSPEWHQQISADQRASLYHPGYSDSTPAPTIVTDGNSTSLEKCFIHRSTS